MTEIFRASHLSKAYPLRKRDRVKGESGFILAVDDLSFQVEENETYGIVGESGCGKTTLARLMTRLIKPTNGDIFFKNQNITSCNRSQTKALRRRIQIIFQDPFSSLNPVNNIFSIVSEPLKIHKAITDKSQLKEKVRFQLDTVGLPTSENFMLKRPNELSGGERQRVGIARAIILGPEFIIGDEPVSMLDASVKAEIVSLLMKLKEKENLTYVFITHEMGVAYNICDRIAVMYAGRMVELGKADEIIERPLHPYTRQLIEAIPPLHPDETWGETILEGEVPLFFRDRNTCSFLPRCQHVKGPCENENPEMRDVGGRWVACHNV
jgi:oligopeptide/dipeptide ABC transporter ATP-binding protein